jgi:hypothetical protein
VRSGRRLPLLIISISSPVEPLLSNVQASASNKKKPVQSRSAHALTDLLIEVKYLLRLFNKLELWCRGRASRCHLGALSRRRHHHQFRTREQTNGAGVPRCAHMPAPPFTRRTFFPWWSPSSNVNYVHGERPRRRT